MARRTHYTLDMDAKNMDAMNMDDTDDGINEAAWDRAMTRPRRRRNRDEVAPWLRALIKRTVESAKEQS